MSRQPDDTDDMPRIERSEYRLEDFTLREVHLMKAALMEKITRLGSTEEAKGLTKAMRADTKALKMEYFKVYERL